jgi:UDP-glucose 4-epimerase
LGLHPGVKQGRPAQRLGPPKIIITMKLLITGASGFIGSRLVAHFKAHGAQVFVDVAERSSAGRTTLSTHLLTQVTGGAVPDAIIHGAGSGTVGQVAADPGSHLPNNLAATLAVLEFARTAAPRAHVVLLSSAAVYGNAPAQPQRETDSRAAASLYGLSKLQSEQLMAHYAQQFNICATSVRLFSVYGPGLRKQLLWDAMNKFVSGRHDFFGTGSEQRDWVHVDDVCHFISKLLGKAAPTGFDIFNCGGQAATTAEVLSVLASQSGAAAPQFNGHTRAGDPPCLVADCSRAQQLLGWQAQQNWRDGVANYAQWFLRQRTAAA